MYSIKPGRSPSAMGGIAALLAGGFGILWIIFAAKLTSSFGFPDFVRVIFPLFGVVFVLICIANAIYNFRNTSAKNRYSVMDITSEEEEPCPLNQTFRAKTLSPSSVETKLAELRSLREKDLITETEYTTQRQRILEQI